MSDWQLWAMVLIIFLAGLLLGSVIHSYWALVLPPAITALWLFHIRNTTNTEPEVGWFGTYLAWTILIMIPGLAGVALGGLVRRKFF